MKILALTHFRFTAAIIVVIFHFGRELNYLPGFLIRGPEMVTFFFVLSGFVLSIAYKGRIFSSTEFMFSRITRIAPAYFMALSLVVFSSYIQGKLYTSDFLLSIFFLQSWVPGYALVLNSPGWSLSVEMFFYVSFHFIFHFVNSNGRSVSVLCLQSFAVWLATQVIGAVILDGDWRGDNFLSYFPPMHLPGFILGIVGGKLFIEQPAFLKRFRGLGFVVACLLFCAVVLEYCQVINAYVNTANGLLSPVFLLLILVVAINNDELGFLKNRKMILLGEASYALYLFQVPVHGVLKRTVLPFIGNDTLSFLCYLVVLVLVSVSVHVFFEKPANRFFRSLIKN
ncbi:acyltransferase [Pseudomonas sp. MH9.2]|uniref:acyltransferase family protein n=1 Tax=unclassified Pseudomonas TaxID=196821 RepID=UPI002AC9486F|nr:MULTISPECIES: acyltransferase [unclassified Pseudomonas]MEB0028821.1 acyltransferase [Pseudomonas sp. MH9.2]MEB0150101.1 acyltransferase [Pseudomonas sp. CCC2.2]MEE3509525.1 acyltransferase [Pseudomonas sp. 10C3]WPX68874.1 acyltransferase [Pseudomonas sp. MH9.2]